MAVPVKPWFLSKTIILAILQGTLGVLAALLAVNPELKVAGVIAILKTALDIVLRFNTSKAVEI